jgi:hypothetical protein
MSTTELEQSSQLEAPMSPKQRHKQVIDDDNGLPVRSKTAIIAAPQPSAVAKEQPSNERDDKGSFDEKDSFRQLPSPKVLSPIKKRKVAFSFDDETCSNTTPGAASICTKVTATTSFASCSSSLPSASFDSIASDDGPLLQLENVTQLSRSLISPELQHLFPKPPLHPKNKKLPITGRMTTGNNNNGTNRNGRKNVFRLQLRRSTEEKQEEEASETPSTEVNNVSTPQRSNASRKSTDNDSYEISSRRGGGVVERIRSFSRSRSSRSGSSTSSEGSDHANKPILVAVTSCRSDAYYHQKAPGSTSKLPRKAPSNLKLFHELAVGIKDAYAAVGQTPKRPVEENDGLSQDILEGKTVLWEFVGNLDFVSKASLKLLLL